MTKLPYRASTRSSPLRKCSVCTGHQTSSASTEVDVDKNVHLLCILDMYVQPRSYIRPLGTCSFSLFVIRTLPSCIVIVCFQSCDTLRGGSTLLPPAVQISRILPLCMPFPFLQTRTRSNRRGLFTESNMSIYINISPLFLAPAP